MTEGEIAWRPIKVWTEIFDEIYCKADANRTPDQMWTAVMAHTSSIGESIRKIGFKDLMVSAAHTFSWLCSFICKCNTLPENNIFSYSDSLCEIVSLKYPNKCGHCRESPCSCNPVTIEERKDKSANYEILLGWRNRDLKAYREYTIKEYQGMFYDIYKERGHIQTLESIGFHFLEEVGEAAVNIRKLSQLRNIAKDSSSGISDDYLKQLITVERIVQYYKEYYEDYYRDEDSIDYTSRDAKMLKARIVDAKMGLVSEIGDSFSWFCGVLNKVDAISKSIWENPGNHSIRSIEQSLNKEYIDADGHPKCYKCNEKPCVCVFYHS